MCKLGNTSGRRWRSSVRQCVNLGTWTKRSAAVRQWAPVTFSLGAYLCPGCDGNSCRSIVARQFTVTSLVDERFISRYCYCCIIPGTSVRTRSIPRTSTSIRTAMHPIPPNLNTPLPLVRMRVPQRYYVHWLWCNTPPPPEYHISTTSSRPEVVLSSLSYTEY